MRTERGGAQGQDHRLLKRPLITQGLREKRQRSRFASAKEKGNFSRGPRFAPWRPRRQGEAARLGRGLPGHQGHNQTEVSLGRRDGVRGVAKSAGPALSASGAKAQAAAVPPQGRDGSKQGQESLVVSCIQD